MRIPKINIQPIYRDDATLEANSPILKIELARKKQEDSYNLIIGPLTNNEGNNLVLSFISKGYKKTEFIFE